MMCYDPRTEDGCMQGKAYDGHKMRLLYFPQMLFRRYLIGSNGR